MECGQQVASNASIPEIASEHCGGAEEGSVQQSSTVCYCGTALWQLHTHISTAVVERSALVSGAVLTGRGSGRATTAMLLSSLFAALSESAARHSESTSAASCSPPSTAATMHGSRGLCTAVSRAPDAAVAPPLLCPQSASSLPDTASLTVWSPRGSSQSSVLSGSDCFHLPASPSPFIQLPDFSPHTAALTGMADCVHSSAWSGVWQWSSLDGSLHSHQHIPPGWSSSRLPPRAVRPLSSWTHFHTGSTQHSMHSTNNPSSGEQQGQRQTAVGRAGRQIGGTEYNAVRLFPFDLPATVSASRTGILSVAPVIGVAVSEGSGEAETAGARHTDQPTATAAPYSVQSNTDQQPSQTGRDPQQSAQATDERVRPASVQRPSLRPVIRLPIHPHSSVGPAFAHLSPSCLC